MRRLDRATSIATSTSSVVLLAVFVWATACSASEPTSTSKSVPPSTTSAVSARPDPDDYCYWQIGQPANATEEDAICRPALPTLSSFPTDPQVSTNVACPPDHLTSVSVNAYGVRAADGSIAISWSHGRPNVEDLKRACDTPALRSG